MKKAILTAVLSISVLSGIPVLVQSAEPADKSPQVEQITPNVQLFDKQMAQSQEYMIKMQEQMDNIRQTQDPQERQNLLQEHWATMQKNTQLMHKMWGAGGGMGCCMQGPTIGPGKVRGWRHMGDQYYKLTPKQLKQRQYMMDRYVPMQQMMMQHLMQHQRYMWDK
ncbi:MAG: hypothetical protein ACJAT7_002600 [Psychromonas sp.]|jgi:hypothetical protein|uniref:hypothetical protein n=1 Tax=Psychromonas sp. TaxID=1884585 RepID=UPI0039E484E4